jgi:hypothetical protein
MDDVWKLLITAGSVLLAAVAGNLIAAYVSRRNAVEAGSNEHRQWLRNQKLEAYSEFLEAYTELYKQVELARSEGRTARDLDEYVAKASPTKITLIAPQEIAALARKIHEHLMWLALWVEADSATLKLAETKRAYGAKSSEFERAAIEDMTMMKKGNSLS